VDFRNFIEDDRVLSDYIKNFGASNGEINVVVPADTTDYELTRLRTIADKINFFNEHTAKIDQRYVILRGEEPVVIETRKKNNERIKKTTDN